MDPKTVEEYLAAQQAVIDGAEGRDLTPEEVTRYEELETGLKRAQKSDEIKQRQAAYQTPATPAFLTVSSPKDDTLERAFNHYMRTGQQNSDIAELRAQGTGTDSAGGYTVPETFRAKLVDRLKEFGGLANEVEVLTTSGGEALRYPTLDDTANTGEIAAESAAGVGGADMVFGEVTLGAYKYVAPGASANPLRVSVEMLQDSAFDIQGLVARKLGERIARQQAIDWVTGTGTGEPTGIATSAGPSSTFAGATPDKDELIAAIHDVDPAYRSGGIWVFNDATLELLRKLEDSQGRPLLMPNSDAGIQGLPGGVLLGHRVVIDQAFANFTDASSNKFGVFGNVREGYIIRRVKAVTLIVDPYSRASNGEVQYTVWARADGTVQNKNAFTVLKNDAA